MTPAGPELRLPSIQRPADLRLYLDKAVERLEIFSLPRVEALLHVYRAIQHLQTANEIGAHLQNRSYRGYDSMRSAQDVLRWLTFKIFELCPPGGSRKIRSFDQLSIAFRTIDEFAAFSSIQDAIVSTEAGLADCRIDTRNLTVSFRPNPAVEDRLAKRIVREAGQRQKNHHRQAETLASVETMERALEELKASMRVDSERQAVDYRVTGRTLRAFSRFLELPVALLPTELSLGPYQLSDFWRVWGHLATLSLIHATVLQISTSSGDPACVYNSAVLRLDQRILLRQLRHRTGLRGSVTSEILGDLTYNPAIRWTDVMYQPLVPLGDGQLLTLPLLVSGSNPERNLLALLDRLKSRRTGAQNLKTVRERLMIEEIRDVAQGTSLGFADRVPLGPKNRRVGDIDLLAWNASGDFVLAISLKWFYGADSMHEIVQQDARFREGIIAHRRCVGYLRDNLSQIARDHGLLDLAPNAVLKGILVSKTGSPSESVDAEDFPIVTSDHLLEAIREYGDDLEAIFQHLSQDPATDLSSNEFRNVELEFQLGDYRFTLPQLKAKLPLDVEPYPVGR